MTQQLAALLFEVRPDDPFTFAAVAAMLLGVAIVACWLPASRAMRIDPAIALKQE